MTKHLPTTGRKGPGLVSESIRKTLERDLNDLVASRDRIYELSRDLRRTSQQAMRRIHAGEHPDGQFQHIRGLTSQLVSEASRRGLEADETVEVALQEAVEANLLFSLVRGKPLPSPESLSVGPVAYLLGLSDLVGEMRRLAVSALSRGHPKEAQATLTQMDEVLSVLMHFDAPRGVIALKHKQDTARNLIERMRGEVAMAMYLESIVEETQRAGRGKGRP